MRSLTFVSKAIFCSLLFFLFNYNANAQQWVLAGSVSNPGNEPSISVVNGNTAWIVGGAPDTPRVYRTTNGGLNWTSIPVSGISNELYCIWATSSTNAFAGEGVVNGNARLFRTTNAGVNWTVSAQTAPTGGYFNCLVFSRSNPLIGGALAEKFYLTTDGGNTWTEINAGGNGVSSAQNSLMLIDANFLGFGFDQGAARVRMSTNSGASWFNQNVNLSGSNTSGFAYKDDKLIGLTSTSTSMPNISRTTNGGTTWTPMSIDTGLTGTTLIKWVSGSNVVYIIGQNGRIKRSTNSGLNWTSMTTANVTGINHFDFIKLGNIIYGYAVSTNGTVIKLADSVLFTGINSIGSEIPSEYRLLQNYPNPFNPSTVISFDLPKSSFAKLTVYDALGRELAVLVNENLNAGRYEYTWDASAYASGVYYYRLTAGSFTESKKMSLLK